MKFLEKDLEQIIFETNSRVLLSKKLPVFGKRFRQLKIGNYGIADLVTVNRIHEETSFCSGVYNHGVHITIYEFKKDKVGISALMQSMKYAKGIQSYMKKYRQKVNFDIEIVLIGEDVDSTGSLIYIPDLICKNDTKLFNNSIIGISFYKYSYKINGLCFEKICSYELKNEGF